MLTSNKVDVTGSQNTNDKGGHNLMVSPLIGIPIKPHYQQGASQWHAKKWEVKFDRMEGNQSTLQLKSLTSAFAHGLCRPTWDVNSQESSPCCVGMITCWASTTCVQMLLSCCVLVLKRLKQEAPWGSLANQPGHIVSSRLKTRSPVSQKKMGTTEKTLEVILWPPYLHMYTLPPKENEEV